MSQQASSPSVPNPKPNEVKPPAEIPKKDFAITESDEVELLGGTDITVKEPPKEVVKEQPKETPKEQPKETPKAKEEPKPKEEPKAKEDEQPKEEPKEEGPNLLKTVPKKEGRDYSGFTEDEAKALKSMSNEAFNFVAPIIKSRKELEKLRDASYLQHPDSYTLHPEYREAQELVSYARREANAWQNELVKVRKGEEWTPLVGVDPKTGEFIYGAKRKPTVEDEEQIRMSMNRCLSVEQQTATKLQQLPQQFQQTVENDTRLIQAERARRFDWVANPELLKHEIETEHGKKTVESFIQDFTALFPVYHQRSIGVQVAADLFVALQVMQARVKAAEAGKAVAEVLKEEATRVEPTTGARPSKADKGKFGIKEFDLEGLPA